MRISDWSSDVCSSDLRYPGRHLRKGELLPAIMLDHIAEQIGVEADVIAQFARRVQTRYEQLAVIKRRYNYCDLTRPGRAELAAWLAGEAIGLTDGKILIERLIRSKERRVGKEGCSKCRSWWSPD